MTADDSETFSIVHGEIDGYQLVGMIRTPNQEEQRKHLPWVLSVSTPFFAPTADGLPITEEADELNSWEEAVECRLAAATSFVFVGRVNWKNHRELLYYVKQPEATMFALQSLIDSSATRPFAFRCELDEEWDEARVYWDKHFPGM